MATDWLFKRLCARNGINESGIKLPDAIIEATAQIENRLLITRNVKDFKNTPGVILPYAM